MCCYSVIFAIFPDFGEKLKVALHCPKSYSTRENQVTSALPSHHLLLSLLCLPKHPFWELMIFCKSHPLFSSL